MLTYLHNSCISCYTKYQHLFYRPTLTLTEVWIWEPLYCREAQRTMSQYYSRTPSLTWEQSHKWALLSSPCSPSLYTPQTHLCVGNEPKLWVTQNSQLASQDPVQLYLVCLQGVFGEVLASARLIERRMYRQRTLTANLCVTEPQMNPVQPPRAEETEHWRCCCCQRMTENNKSEKLWFRRTIFSA